MKKLGFISLMNGSSWGGSEELWSDCASFALDQNIEVYTLIYKWPTLHSKISELREKGAKIFFREQQSSGFSEKLITRLIKSYKREYKYFKPFLDECPDILVINQGSTYDFLYQKEVAEILIKTEIPFVIICHFNNEHGSLSQEQRDIANKIFDKALAVYFVAKRNLTNCERQLCRKLKNASLVSNPVNLAEFSIVPYPENTTLEIASVARLDCDYKGQDILLESLSGDEWRNRNFNINFYGKGKDEKYLRDLTKYYNLEEKVKFKGFEKNIRNIWSVNHILVLPSVGEGTPITMVEAMLCGRGCIGTDVGGISEYVIEGQTGFLAQGVSVNAINEALNRAWKKRNDWKNIGEKAFELVNNKFDKNAGKSLYNKLKGLV